MHGDVMSWRHIMCEAAQKEELPLTVRGRPTATAEMALKLQLYFLVCLYAGIAESSAVETLTVMEGQTLTLSCSVSNTSNDHVEWRNPHDFVVFFNNYKVLKDKRYKVINVSSSEVQLSLSNVIFRDGGVYKCLEYTHPVTTKLFRVTVVGHPKLEATEHEDKFAIKCSSQANFPPPTIFWLFENGLEVQADPHYRCDSNKCTSLDILLVRAYKRRVTVTCIARHQGLYSSHLMNFITIVNNSIEEPRTASTPGHLSTTSASTPTAPRTQSTTGLEFITDSETPALGTTESTLINSSMSTNSSTEGSLTEMEKRKAEPGSPLLIFLVTCLILALLVVVTFFAIKLRRAHVLWKKENEDTDQSLESNKSKSSHEDKQAQERRGHGSVIKPGFQNTIFTKYRREDSVDKEATVVQNGHSAAQIHVTVETHDPRTCPQVKETDL
ncbi:cytotoxic and regulatory T-cell molecule [Scleropages formosus]|uniref:Ig-like domain-containing protein n=1 Tax=Scleropages formosus TaxID=113540 RepID=A0A8C9V2G9_SCLFO|nr:cytotoxic and regulatory T-cell molecule [Scleropages formosus]